MVICENCRTISQEADIVTYKNAGGDIGEERRVARCPVCGSDELSSLRSAVKRLVHEEELYCPYFMIRLENVIYCDTAGTQATQRTELASVFDARRHYGKFCTSEEYTHCPKAVLIEEELERRDREEALERLKQLRNRGETY